MKMDKDKWTLFASYFIIYAVLITIVCLVLDGFFTKLSSWYFYLFQAIFFGLFMAAFEMWQQSRKKK